MDLGVIDIQGLDLVWWQEPPYPIQLRKCSELDQLLLVVI
jgi:hypothetical protein